MNDISSAPEMRSRIKTLNRIAWVITIIVWLLVGAMRRIKIPVDIDLSFLAGFNALCNTGVAIALLVALYFVRNKRIDLHRKSIYVAMILSAGFLLSYVAYHFTQEEVPYCGQG
nr:DUF420 domain-containing protein [Bacteroidota bacterium]